MLLPEIYLAIFLMLFRRRTTLEKKTWRPKVVLLEKNWVDKKIKGDMYFVKASKILGLLQKC